MGYVGELAQLNVAHRCRQNWLLLPQREGVLILAGSLGSCALGKGKRWGVRGDPEVSPWFSNSLKWCKGPGLGREKAWKEGHYWKLFVKIWRYCGCLNQVGNRKGECVWLEDIKGWEGSGKLCRNQGWLYVWTVMFFFLLPELCFLPPHPFSRRTFGAHRSPFSIFTWLSQNYILLSKKPCSPSAKSLSFVMTFLHWLVLPEGGGGEVVPNQAALETPARSCAGLIAWWRSGRRFLTCLSTAARPWRVHQSSWMCCGQWFFQKAFHEEQRSAVEPEFLRLPCPKVPTELIVKHKGLFIHSNQHNGYWEISSSSRKC